MNLQRRFDIANYHIDSFLLSDLLYDKVETRKQIPYSITIDRDVKYFCFQKSSWINSVPMISLNFFIVLNTVPKEIFIL